MDRFDDWTMVHLVRKQAERFGDRTYMSFDTGLTLTYAGLNAQADRLAAALAARGVGRDDRVFCFVKNRAEFMIALFGIMKAGAIFVPINTELKGAFLQHQLRNAEPKVALVDTDLVHHFDGVDAGDAAPAHVVIVAGAVPADMPDALAGAQAATFDDFLASGDGEPVPDSLPTIHDTAAIMYTSGTTGPAKGVLLPHGHFYVWLERQIAKIGQTEDDVYYICMPLFHVNALNLQALGTFMAGGRAHVVQRFSPNRWLDDVIDSGATLTNLLGVMPEFVFNTAPDPRDRDHALRLVLAVPISTEWGAAMQDRFGFTIVQGFGMTEVGMTAWGDTGESGLEPGCAGYIDEDFYEVRIGDPETDVPVGVDQVGELLIRPKYAGIFSAGYYRMPERTVEAWRNLWFHTGDACRIDAKGRLHYVDRIKDCIRRRGENISAFEVEQVINGHPDIAESAVVGVKVEGAGGEEEVMAVIVEQPGKSVAETDLLDFCTPRMPRYAVPRFVLKIAELDKTASGKLRKGDLRDAGVTGDTWDRETVGYEVAR
ncbi:AMP-binding protein [Minwuia sp.]|uniref:AMP-binding protein n=1 Tax=Minwuia sp. TaxID=2493630 RepID=UPI003A8F6B2A